MRFNEILEYIAKHPRVIYKILIFSVAVVGLAVKVIKPKINEYKMRMAENIDSRKKQPNSGNADIQQGMNYLNQNNDEAAANAFVMGLRQGSDDDRLPDIYKFLMDYYSERKQYHETLRWGRHAAESNIADAGIYKRMGDVYTLIGEEEKAEECYKKMV